MYTDLHVFKVLAILKFGSFYYDFKTTEHPVKKKKANKSNCVGDMIKSNVCMNISAFRRPKSASRFSLMGGTVGKKNWEMEKEENLDS